MPALLSAAVLVAALPLPLAVAAAVLARCPRRRADARKVVALLRRRGR